MVKQKDVRVGNYFQEVTGQVYKLSPGDISKWNDDREMYNPIPIKLTEDWCRRLKLKSDSHLTYHKIGNEPKDKIVNIFSVCGNIEVRENCSDKKFTVVQYYTDPEYGCQECWKIVEIEFVHELQNLYFTLNKEELYEK